MYFAMSKYSYASVETFLFSCLTILALLFTLFTMTLLPFVHLCLKMDYLDMLQRLNSIWDVLLNTLEACKEQHEALENMHTDWLKTVFLFNKINTFCVAVCLFSNKLQMMSKCGKNKKEFKFCDLMLLPHFDVNVVASNLCSF